MDDAMARSIRRAGRRKRVRAVMLTLGVLAIAAGGVGYWYGSWASLPATGERCVPGGDDCQEGPCVDDVCHRACRDDRLCPDGLVCRNVELDVESRFLGSDYETHRQAWQYLCVPE